MICNVDPVATVAVWLRVMRLLAASTMATPETIIRMRGTAILLAIFKSYGYPEIEGTFRLKKIDQKYSMEVLNEWTDTRVPRGGSDGVHTTWLYRTTSLAHLSWNHVFRQF